MKTIGKGSDALPLHDSGHALDNNVEVYTFSAIMVPLLIVLLTMITIALQSYLMSLPVQTPTKLPTLPILNDVPFVRERERESVCVCPPLCPTGSVNHIAC